MRDYGGGALSAITVSSRELVVRGAAGAGLVCVCVCNARGSGLLHPLQKAIPTRECGNSRTEPASKLQLLKFAFVQREQREPPRTPPAPTSAPRPPTRAARPRAPRPPRRRNV